MAAFLHRNYNRVASLIPAVRNNHLIVQRSYLSIQESNTKPNEITEVDSAKQVFNYYTDTYTQKKVCITLT